MIQHLVAILVALVLYYPLGVVGMVVDHPTVVRFDVSARVGAGVDG